MLRPIEVTAPPDPARVRAQALNACQVGFDRLAQADGGMFAEETPVVFRYNGFAHAVMMATPADLSDFAFGFSLTEGIVADASGIADLESNRADEGLALDVRLDPDSLRRYLRQRRVRMLRGHTSCGICGAEDLSDVHGSLPRLQTGPALDATTMRLALERLRDFQPLSRCTAAAHAAAWAGTDGSIVAVREDVGRHNALDKLIGAGLQGAFPARDGFCLITSRCSFEMVQKAARAGFATVVSAGAPTALAIRTAEAAGLRLYSRSSRHGKFMCVSPCNCGRIDGDEAES